MRITNMMHSAVLLALTAVLIAGCGASRARLYEGPEMPKDRIAVISGVHGKPGQWGITAVTGDDFSKRNRDAEVLPGIYRVDKVGFRKDADTLLVFQPNICFIAEPGFAYITDGRLSGNNVETRAEITILEENTKRSVGISCDILHEDPEKFDRFAGGDGGIVETMHRQDMSRLQTLAAQGPKPGDLVFKGNRTALLYALELKLWKVVYYLVSQGAYTQARLREPQGEQDITPLMAIMPSKNAALVELLISKGADVNARSASGMTALMFASKYKAGTQVVDLLLAHGADPEARTAKGVTALNYAVAAKDIDVVRMLATRMGPAARQDADTAGSPLLSALQGDNAEIFLLLADAGFNYQAITQDGRNYLMIAAGKGLDSVVRYLIQKGLDINARDQKGNSALMYAALKDRRDTIVLLIDKGADVNAADNEGNSILIMTMKEGSGELQGKPIVEYLLRRGAKVNATYQGKTWDHGLTPLMIAAGAGHRRQVEILLEKGADVRARARDGSTALIRAVLGSSLSGIKVRQDPGKAEQRRIEEEQALIVKRLLVAGADPNQVYDKGRTILAEACSRDLVQVAWALVAGGAWTTVKDYSGKTPLMYFSEEGQKMFDEMRLKNKAK